MSVTILHTGDIHLGAPFKHLGKRAPEQRKQLRDTFKKVVDTAVEKNVDVFLIAGDLYDANTVGDKDVYFGREQLQRLNDAHIPTILIGGTHDCLADAAVLKRQGVLDDFEYVTLLTPENPQIEIQHLGLTISGTSNTTNKSRTSPLKNFPVKTETPFHIGMIHGSLAIPGKHAENDMPFTQEEIEATGLDYLAVGHWHSYNDISSEHVKAFYAGSPEAIDFGEHKAGYILLVTLEEGTQPQVEPIRVGTRTFAKKEIDITGMEHTTELLKHIVCDADGNCAMEIVLKGVRKPEVLLNTQELEQELTESFFKVLVKDTTSIAVEEIHPEAYPEHMVIGQFLRKMQRRLQEEQDEQRKRVLETALQVGLIHLRGKDE